MTPHSRLHLIDLYRETFRDRQPWEDKRTATDYAVQDGIRSWTPEGWQRVLKLAAETQNHLAVRFANELNQAGWSPSQPMPQRPIPDGYDGRFCPMFR